MPNKAKERKHNGASGVRTTIYVPKKVKERMDAFGKEEAVSWSQVAAAAFNRYINERTREKSNGRNEVPI